MLMRELEPLAHRGVAVRGPPAAEGHDLRGAAPGGGGGVRASGRRHAARCGRLLSRGLSRGLSARRVRVQSMARAIWSGAISFGLVNIPVKLYSAVSKKTVRFHQLDSKDNTRIQQKRVNPNTGEEVPFEQLVKGYELSPDRYVVIKPEELDSRASPRRRARSTSRTSSTSTQIDPIYYDHPYYLAPGTGAGQALQAAAARRWRPPARSAIARVVIRSKENLVAIRPRERRAHDGDAAVRRRGRAAGGPRRAARGRGRGQGHQEGGRHGAAADRLAGVGLRPVASTATSTATRCSR